MSDAALLTPGAGNGAGVTTTRHSAVGRKGDLLVELHFGDFGTGHGRQAALALVRPGRPPAFVPLTTMWQYMEREAMHLMVPPLAEKLYGFVTKMDCYRILDAILDYMDDLRASPPDPALTQGTTFDDFLESCVQEGLDFCVERGGKREWLT